MTFLGFMNILCSLKCLIKPGLRVAESSLLKISAGISFKEIS